MRDGRVDSGTHADSGGGLAASVVIPTHNRETRLAFALEALAGQTLDPALFEVIVVRPEVTAPPLATAPEGLDVSFLDRSGPPTRPGQRNSGWRAAAGGLIAFTDDDCRPAATWLEELLEGRDGPDVFVQGRTEPDPDEAHLLHGLARSVEVIGPSPWYPTCNMAYPRTLLERVGGFDEAFVASGEDTDLALRAIEQGARCEYRQGALVHHAVLAQPLHEAAAAGWRRWESTPLVFKRHPEHRRHLVGGVFFNRSHAALTALAAGVVVARRRPALAAVAAAPFVLEGLDTANLGPRGLVRQAVHVPARLLREAFVMAGVLRGALRHRTPVV
jgi:GT2 family glycosyltransferase